jgi:hypothetical protein
MVSDSGNRDQIIAWLFYGGLGGIMLYVPYLCGYVAGRIAASVSGWRPAAVAGYAGLVTSLLAAIIVGEPAIFLGAAPSFGVLASALAVAFALRRDRDESEPRLTGA